MNSQDRSAEPTSTRLVDRIIRGLIRRAARQAPPELSERLGEEWLADLTARSATLSQLRFALGCCWATAVIARELGTPVRVGAAAVNDRTTVAYGAPGPSFLARRPMVALVIVGLHTLVIFGLASGIASKVLEAIPPRTDVVFLPKPAPPVEPPPPVDPNPTHFRPVIRDPGLPYFPPDVTSAIQDPIPQDSPHQLPTRPIPKPVRVPGGPGAGFPSTDDFYPQAALRLAEAGSATVNVCVDGAGRLVGKPTIERSSGSPRLDEGALRLAKAGSGHYRPTTEDGRPVSACYPFRIRFDLRNR